MKQLYARSTDASLRQWLVLNVLRQIIIIRLFSLETDIEGIWLCLFLLMIPCNLQFSSALHKSASLCLYLPVWCSCFLGHPFFHFQTSFLLLPWNMLSRILYSRSSHFILALNQDSVLLLYIFQKLKAEIIKLRCISGHQKAWIQKLDINW